MRSSSSSPDPTTGSRGSGWVVTQFVLMAVIIAAGFLFSRMAGHSPNRFDGDRGRAGDCGHRPSRSGRREASTSLTPFPKPLGTGLVTHGPFAIVRHPIYTGGLAFFAGYALFASVPALILTAMLGILWVGKIRVEERLLTTVYDGMLVLPARAAAADPVRLLEAVARLLQSVEDVLARSRRACCRLPPRLGCGVAARGVHVGRRLGAGRSGRRSGAISTRSSSLSSSCAATARFWRSYRVIAAPTRRRSASRRV